MHDTCTFESSIVDCMDNITDVHTHLYGESLLSLEFCANVEKYMQQSGAAYLFSVPATKDFLQYHEISTRLMPSLHYFKLELHAF